MLIVDYLPQRTIGVILTETVQDGVERFLEVESNTNVDTKLLQPLDLSWGGPLGLNEMFLVSYNPVDGTVDMTSDKHNVVQRGNAEITTRFVGYTGWRAGQLETEIRNGDWRVYRADPEKVSSWLNENNQSKELTVKELND